MTNKQISFSHKEFEQKVDTLLSFLQIPYKNISLYVQSFVHKSILNEKITNFQESNERLEFFGDAILELVVTEKLFFDFPEKEEGELTDIRSAIVRWKNLANVAVNLKFDEFIILSKWEILGSWNTNPYILANTLEAFLWAIYIDTNYDFVKNFIIKYIYIEIDEILKNSLHIDPKSYLQEIIQSKFNFTPIYEVLEESWLDHDKNYKVWVYNKNILLWIWNWSSKKKAQKDAAQNAIINKNNWITLE